MKGKARREQHARGRAGTGGRRQCSLERPSEIARRARLAPQAARCSHTYRICTVLFRSYNASSGRHGADAQEQCATKPQLQGPSHWQFPPSSAQVVSPLPLIAALQADHMACTVSYAASLLTAHLKLLASDSGMNLKQLQTSSLLGEALDEGGEGGRQGGGSREQGAAHQMFSSTVPDAIRYTTCRAPPPPPPPPPEGRAQRGHPTHPRTANQQPSSVLNPSCVRWARLLGGSAA